MRSSTPHLCTGIAIALLIPFFSLQALTLSAQSPDTYWYQNRQKDEWHFQPDVFAFKCVNGQNFTGSCDPNVVETVVYRGSRPERSVEIRFKSNVTPVAKQWEKNRIRQHPDFSCEYPVITRDPAQNHLAEQWYIVDDLVMVTFANPKITPQEVAAFRQRHQLLSFSEPSTLLPEANWTYVFRLSPALCGLKTAIDVAREIIETETDLQNPNLPNFVLEATPNIANVIRPMPQPGTGGQLTTTGNPVRCVPDPDTDKMWYFESDGSFGIPSQNSTSFAGADANICECRDSSLTGAGVTVAVLGQAWVDFNHPDLSGKFVDGWDCRNPPCQVYNQTSQPGTPVYYTLAGASGVIAAKSGNQAGAEGVAPGVSIMPVIIADPAGGSWVSLMNGINEAASTPGIDVVVIQTFAPNNNPNIQTNIRNWASNGRSHVTGPLGTPGTVFVAPAGGYPIGLNPGIPATLFPAADTNVIGVIASNPHDSLKYLNDGWDTQGPFGGYWGKVYDVAAPGGPIFAAGHQINTYGYLDEPYYPPSAVVGGIVALILERNYALPSEEVRKRIRNGAEKVGGYSYQNGVSQELANGRVNCGNTIRNLNVSREVKNQLNGLKILNPVTSEFKISFPEPHPHPVHINLFDLTGKTLFQGDYPTGTSQVFIPTDGFSTGLFFLTISYSNDHPPINRKIWVLK